MQISREDYDKVSEEINKRFQEEMLFDQLVTTVIEWHEAMVKFAARSDAASVSSYLYRTRFLGHTFALRGMA